MNKAKLKKKFILGTANFTQTYGIQPTHISSNEIEKILNLAKKNKIYKIDTAEAYLKKGKVFKKIDKKFKIISKIKIDLRWLSLEFCQKKIENHLKHFVNSKVEVLLVHNIEIFLTKNGSKIFKNLEVLKKRKYFRKIGFSIYQTNSLSKLISNYNFDVVQCPYNILDKRILNTGWFDILKNQGKEIHVRSIFLQGLLVNKAIYKKNYFKKWKKSFFNWFNFLENKNISPIDYCLSDLLGYDFDQIVIGVNNYKNLEEIINFKIIKKNNMINFNINDTKLIDPRNWK